jgi:hypothetical protein
MSVESPKIQILDIIHIKDDCHWECYNVIMSDSEKNIICKIDKLHQCCEEFGIITNPIESELSKFIGSIYFSVNVAEVKLEECVIINITTNKDNLQFTLFNKHNGYYPHDIYIKTENYDKILSI